MKKVIAWIISILGLLIIAGGVEVFNKVFVNVLPFLEEVESIYFFGIGIMVLIIGIVFLRDSSRGIKKGEELPIFEGEGKKKRIVGYKRHKK